LCNDTAIKDSEGSVSSLPSRVHFGDQGRMVRDSVYCTLFSSCLLFFLKHFQLFFFSPMRFLLGKQGLVGRDIMAVLKDMTRDTSGEGDSGDLEGCST